MIRNRIADIPPNCPSGQYPFDVGGGILTGCYTISQITAMQAAQAAAAAANGAPCNANPPPPCPPGQPCSDMMPMTMPGTMQNGICVATGAPSPAIVAATSPTNLVPWLIGGAAILWLFAK